MIVTIVLIGGARRVTLANWIKKLTQTVDIECKFVSIEKDLSFYPISSIATIVAGPSFKAPTFTPFLESMLQQAINPIAIACMDGAVPAIARLRGTIIGTTKIIAPSEEGAMIALNKQATSEFCAKFEITHPQTHRELSSVRGKSIAKPREGFGGKGIYIFDQPNNELESLLSTHVVQDFIEGLETTHDLYIGFEGQITAVSRDRLAVIDGEVDHCIVRHPAPDEQIIFRKIAETNLFFGPLTVQTIRHNDTPYLIEINARFGGGATAGIASGAPLVERLIQDATGRVIPERPFRQLEMKRARSDFYRFLDGT